MAELQLFVNDVSHFFAELDNRVQILEDDFIIIVLFTV